MNGDGSARRNMAYSYGFKAIKVPGERGDDGKLTPSGFQRRGAGEDGAVLSEMDSGRWC